MKVSDSWMGLVESIKLCQGCARFHELSPFTDDIVFPNPLDYASRVNLILISWAPPGKSKAVREKHFFHNAKSPDRLRSLVFNSVTKERPDFQLDPTPSRAEQSLKRFYSLGLYLVPTIFRRIKNDVKPSDRLIEHSSQAHLQEVLAFLAQRQRALRVILLGETPSRAFARLFQKHEGGARIAMALRKQPRVATARNLTIEQPLDFQISSDSSLDVWISNWPRGKGYKVLARDITRALAWSA